MVANLKELFEVAVFPNDTEKQLYKNLVRELQTRYIESIEESDMFNQTEYYFYFDSRKHDDIINYYRLQNLLQQLVELTGLFERVVDLDNIIYLNKTDDGIIRIDKEDDNLVLTFRSEEYE